MRDGAGRVKRETQLDDKSKARIRSLRACKLDKKTEIAFSEIAFGEKVERGKRLVEVVVSSLTPQVSGGCLSNPIY